jgi:hypothetical protein
MQEEYAMNNHEAVVATLARHREARNWTDHAVADDLCQQLDLNPTGEASKARMLVDPSMISEDEVVAHETAAKLAAQKATEARAKLNEQKADEAKPHADESADHAKLTAVATTPGPTPQQIAANERTAAAERAARVELERQQRERDAEAERVANYRNQAAQLRSTGQTMDVTPTGEAPVVHG